MPHTLRWQPCIDAASILIDQMQRRGEPVWLTQAVRDILSEHPDCGLTEDQLAEIIRQLVVRKRWSLAA